MEIEREDEIGQLGTWFNRFVSRIHDTIVQVGMATREVAGAATEIAAGQCEAGFIT
jgi:methyl-accepting chemotaxis protein